MQETAETSSFYQRNAIIIKALVVFVLTLLLLIPTNMVQSIIYERESRKSEAVNEVSSKWADPQTITGPILAVPFTEIVNNEQIKDGKKIVSQTKRRNIAYFLPDDLKVNGDLVTQKRVRGIYEVVLYTSQTKFQGKFSSVAKALPNVVPSNIDWAGAKVLVLLSDFRGIENEVALNLNNSVFQFTSGGEMPTGVNGQVHQGIQAFVNLEKMGQEAFDFSFTLNLKGSSSLSFTPVGKKSDISLASKWPDPKFEGAFLPDNRKVSKDGFTANWNVLQLNRAFPQSWINTSPASLSSADFSVSLISLNDNYQQSHRSVKYAILVIALTFLSFFFSEIMNGVRIHPISYLLIGLALCIFYTLLVSISEFLTFSWAYLIAMSMTIFLVFVYARSLFNDKRVAGVLGLILLFVYLFIFIIIRLEDTALLIGSIGLFLILAIVMYISRKIDWNSVGKESKQSS